MLSPYTADKKQVASGDMLWGDVFMDNFWTLNCHRMDHERSVPSKHSCKSTVHLYGVLSSQLEMESFSRIMPHATRLELCWCGSKSIKMSSS